MIFAKTNKHGGVNLSDHTKMVINVAIETAKRNCKDLDNSTIEKIAIACITHDIGKCTSDFQEYIKNKNLDDESAEQLPEKPKDSFVRHNVVSWAFICSCLSGLSKVRYQGVRSSVLYHHTIACDPEETAGGIISRIMETDPGCLGTMQSFFTEMVQFVNDKHGLSLSENKDFQLLQIEDRDDLCNTMHIKDETLYPAYDSHGSSIEKSYESAMIRGLVVYADRLVSSELYNRELLLEGDREYIKNIYDTRISTSYNKEPDYSGYDMKRLSYQVNIVNEIKNGENGAWEISASAGFGKTMIGLMHHFSEKKKTMWVVPRVIIAESTYRSIVKELVKLKMDDAVKVGLFYNGEFKDNNFSETNDIYASDCDIIVIVIDSFLSRYSKNNLSNLLVDSYFGDVVFDEYHEFVCNEPLFSAFVNLVYLRKEHTNTKTLLLSATGHDMSNIWWNENYHQIKPDIYGGDIKVKINVIRLETVDDMVPDQNNNSFTIMPTVKSGQKMYQRNEGRNIMLIHARFTPEDRAEKERLLDEMYGKDNTCDDKVPVIGTSIIGTGLDISARSITQCMPTPESTIQVACGRGSRFKEYEEVTYNVVAVKDRNINKFMKSFICDGSILHMWIDCLEKHNGEVLTKNELYEMRRDFYERNRRLINNFIQSRYEKSATSLSKIRHKSGTKFVITDHETCVKGFTYRGESDTFYATLKQGNHFIKPLVCDAPILAAETDSTQSNKERYDFMFTDTTGSGFTTSFPNKYQLRYGYNIKQKNEATKDKCYEMAYRSDRPMLLLNHGYTSELGLYQLHDELYDEESEEE